MQQKIKDNLMFKLILKQTWEFPISWTIPVHFVNKTKNGFSHSDYFLQEIALCLGCGI